MKAKIKTDTESRMDINSRRIWKTGLLLLSAFMGAAFLTGAFSFTAFAEPVQQGTDWYYVKEDKSTARNEFIRMDGELYYFGPDGKLVRESLLDYGGELYYCDAGGKILRDSWKYCVFSDTKSNGWRYFLTSGKAFQNGWLTVGDRRWHFTDSLMDLGWYSEETGAGTAAVYYLGSEEEGYVHEGWLAWKGEDLPGGEDRPAGWYYFKPGTGKMTADTELLIGQDTYAFNSSGVMTAGFCSITEGNKTREKYYDPQTGKRAEGWLWLEEGQGDREEGWYYFTEGVPFEPGTCTRKLSENTGVSRIDGNWYCFDKTGRMQTGLVKAKENVYYCFAEDGRLMTGYVKVPEGGEEPPAEYMLFSVKGSAPPVLGASVTGAYGGKQYSGGVRISEKSD